ncbi:hypothetical protein [Flavobacterium sp.]|uniref:LPD3 domain-containing protein n=1 Tax=Flavobacterium sp. TaxID=239 RepID=UPI00374D557E
MSVIARFNDLNNRDSSREEIESLLVCAKAENNTEIVFRLSKVLNTFPDKDLFHLTIKEYKEAGLNGLQHTGEYKEALDDCGRLKKGYKFHFGKIVKVEAKVSREVANVETLVTAKLQEKTTKSKVAKRILKETPAKVKKEVRKVATKSVDVLDLPVTKIFTDEKRFQNRNKLNEHILTQIIKNYSSNKFDAIVIWHDTKLKKDFVLAGHHRFEAIKRLGKKSIMAKFFNGTEAEAVQYAKVESNANRSLELPQERAKIWREKLQNTSPKEKKEIFDEAKKIEGKNANYILNLSFLNPKGLMLQTLDSLGETPDKQNATIIEKMADWIGEARKQFFGKLNDANEVEMFKFLQDKNQSLRIKTKADFLHIITANTGLLFHYGDTLNLARFKNKTEGENAYDSEYKELQTQIETAIANKQNLIDRIKNPTHKDFINPKDKDYNLVIKALEKAIDKYNNEIKIYQSKLIDLSRKKGSYTSAGSNQVGLFGGLEISTETFKKMSVTELRNFTIDYYNKNLKGKKVAIKNALKEVFFTANAGRKILKPIYSEKVAVIEHLEELIKNSTYNNFGLRKNSDSKDVLGFLNFKSKITIDGIKRHVRISVILDIQRKTKFKSFEVGKIKKSGNFSEVQKIGNPKDGEIKPLSNNKDNKNNTKNKNNSENGLNIPKPVATNRQSLAYKMANKPAVAEYFTIGNKDISSFLGKVERKQKESVFISLTGGQGSMKTRMCFQFMNALAQNYKVGHASIEEHPESVLYFDKAKQYLNQTALNNIESPEITNLQELHALVENNDVIVIDSYTKMQEMVKGFEVDKDLRKKYNGKLFIVIFQQTTDGKMRGGSKSQFDADIVLFTKKEADYRDNYIYADKNRYQNKPLDGLHFNIYNGKLVAENSETESTDGLENTLEQINKLLSFSIN